MYLLYTKIEIQTNTHIPITPYPHRKHSSSPTYTKHITHKKNKRSGDTIYYLLPQMKQIRLMYATVRGGTASLQKGPHDTIYQSRENRS